MNSVSSKIIQKGFILIEVIICFVITSIMIAAIVSVAIQFSASVKLWSERELALQSVRQILFEIFNNSLSSRAFLSTDWQAAIASAPIDFNFVCKTDAIDAPNICYPRDYIEQRISGLQDHLATQLPGATLHLTACDFDNGVCLGVRWPKCFLLKNMDENTPCIRIPLFSIYPA
ncbi:MAG: prepilin-type N-terminal cleavage/methylation domain-containing protein [Pseudomonadota bacterium]